MIQKKYFEKEKKESEKEREQKHANQKTIRLINWPIRTTQNDEGPVKCSNQKSFNFRQFFNTSFL